ncbi:MAG: hypothetical protein QOF61_2551 [Acidobacteriota bacterium]|nr:hypothetical protein [Acidobacteriota bacterium]
MHDCRRTKERLIDLVFDEAGDDALRAEIEACPGCRAERRALTETLRAYERANDAARPTEDFWTAYHARLAARLHAAEIEHDSSQSSQSLPSSQRHAAPSPEHFSASPERLASSPARLSSSTARFSSAPARLPFFASRLGGALTMSWRVPAPAAIAAVLLIMCLSAYALLRPAPAPLAITSPAVRLDAPAPQVLRVEVPVVRQRVVTRTIYVPRTEALPSERIARGEAERVREGGNGVAPAASTLVGFRPAEDVRLRVIKGNYANEK